MDLLVVALVVVLVQPSPEMELETQQLEHDCVKVTLHHHGLQASCYVSSFHLVADKQPQLERALQRLLEASEGV